MLCEPGFDSMGFYSLWEGACRQAEHTSRLVLREGKKVVAAAVVPHLKGRGAQL